MQQAMNTKVSNLQFFIMVIGAITPFGHFIYVHMAILFAGRDAWVSLLLGSALGAAVVFTQLKLSAAYCEQSLMECTVQTWGKYLGGLIGCMYIAFFLLVSTITIHVLALFSREVFHSTPSVVFLLTALALVAWSLFLGLEVIARLFEFLLPILMLSGMLVSFLTLPDKDLMNLLPILDEGILPVWQGSVVFISMFSEWIVFSMISLHVKEPKKLVRQGLITVGVLVVMFLGPVTGPIVLFNPEMARAHSYPTYEEIRFIAFADFLERLDLFGLFLWIMGSFMRLSVFTWGAMKGIVHLLHVKNQKVTIYAVIVFVAALSYCLRSLTIDVTNQYLIKYYLPFAIFAGFVIPLLTILVDRLKGALRSIFNGGNY